jgi:hypothetical protein
LTTNRGRISDRDADWQDHEGACVVLMRLRQQCPRLRVVLADSANARNQLPAWVQATFGWVWQTVLHPIHVQRLINLLLRLAGKNYI